MNTELFIKEVKANLEDNILRFWSDKMKNPYGGFHGRIAGDGTVDAEAPKGVILNARIMWAYSAAFKATGKKEYLLAAARAKEYFTEHFLDHRFGGVYWSLTSEGVRLETKKQLYSQVFAIYGLSEYYSVSGDDEAFKAAKNIYTLIEKEYADKQNGGYIEALARDFSPLDDMTLSDHDINAAKTMNSHLHLLEAYANLYRIWPDKTLKAKTTALLNLVIDKIMDAKTGHLNLYFNADWSVIPGTWSYGHDIETSWLALEAAFDLHDVDLVAKVRPAALKMAKAALEGLNKDGSLKYEKDDDSRQWWVEAENVVGNLWLWKYHNDNDGAERALACWNYIKENLVDTKNGEWYWACDASGKPDTAKDKAGFWKCPYHNTRMCLQVLELL